MGVDLTVFPIRKFNNVPIGGNKLTFHRDYDLFDFFDPNNSNCCQIYSFNDTLYMCDHMSKTHDAYGDELTYCYPISFAKIDMHYAPYYNDICYWNKCIIKFLTILDNSTLIVLFWH